MIFCGSWLKDNTVVKVGVFCLLSRSGNFCRCSYFMSGFIVVIVAAVSVAVC